MKNSIILLTIFITFNSNAYDRITGLEFASRSEVLSTNGMAATSHPLATQTALSILTKWWKCYRCCYCSKCSSWVS